MRYRKYAIACLLAGLAVFAGCGTDDVASGEQHLSAPVDAKETEDSSNTAEKADVLTLYQPILEKTAKLLSEGAEAEMDLDGMSGILDVRTALASSEEALACIGYCIEDISGDGIPELLLGTLMQEDGTGGEVFAVYTIVDGAPRCSVEGWYRSRYYLLENGEFFYMGSAGAAYSIIGRYVLSADGTALDCRDFYFTEPNDEDWDENKYYYNTTGEYDAALAEEVTAEVYYQAERDWQAQTKAIAYIPFAAYTPDAQAK